MSTDNPSIMSHVSLGTSQFEKATAFYDVVLGVIGAKRVMDLQEFKAVAYGKQFPEFWVQAPHDGNPPSIGNGTHFSFLARSQEEVNNFYKAAIEAGATSDGEPGPRPHYGEQYYGCFVRDLDGHKIEAMHWSGE